MRRAVYSIPRVPSRKGDRRRAKQEETKLVPITGVSWPSTVALLTHGHALLLPHKPFREDMGEQNILLPFEEFRKQTDYISIVFIHTERARAGALVLVSLHLP